MEVKDDERIGIGKKVKKSRKDIPTNETGNRKVC
jgi:hypothetical protein